MSDLDPAAIAAELAVRKADRAAYRAVVADLNAAAGTMRRLSEMVTVTVDAVQDCAGGTTQLAELAAALDPPVDPDTIAEHRQAARLMHAAAVLMTEIATGCAEMAGQFTRAADAHEDDYGQIVAVAQAMPVDMAARTFYARR